MIKRYNNISLATGIAGLLLQIGGNIAINTAAEGASRMEYAMDLAKPDPLQQLMGLLGYLSLLVGTALLVVGFAYYAKAKKRSPFWCVFGFLSCLGLLVLASLKDYDDGEILVPEIEVLPELDPIPEPEQ